MKNFLAEALKWTAIVILAVAIVDVLFVQAFGIHDVKEYALLFVRWVLENVFAIIGALFETIFGSGVAQRFDLGALIGAGLVIYVIYAVFHKK
ncbi:hypothetical protein HYT05_00925 [Candidatus Kaiserbacteria bacterium]|nr:hypothetical protein [Candidatus Kaiserbacteria bacterium]